MEYLVEAMSISATLVLVSIPFMVVEPKPLARSDPWFWACGVWLGVVVYALSATARSMRQFVTIAMVEK